MHDPVSFKLTVGKRRLEAQFVSTAYTEGTGFLFHIKFNDGHQGEYELDAFRVYNSDGSQDEYCTALKDEIYNPLFCWTRNSKLFVVNFTIGKTERNIWVSEHFHEDKKERYYSVYNGNDYLCYLKKNGTQWLTHVPEAYGERAIDPGLLKKVIAAIHYYTDK
ncbi:MAG: hypothetical protein QM764_21855 [Chitinophagaceae bacterium]